MSRFISHVILNTETGIDRDWLYVLKQLRHVGEAAIIGGTRILLVLTRDLGEDGCEFEMLSKALASMKFIRSSEAGGADTSFNAPGGPHRWRSAGRFLKLSGSFSLQQ
jgi:hypothetical protein